MLTYIRLADQPGLLDISWGITKRFRILGLREILFKRKVALPQGRGSDLATRDFTH
jgi:hypothetical protein